MVREVEAHLYTVEREGKKLLYRAVIGAADAQGLKKGMFFRFKIRTATGGLSDEFVPKLLDKKNCFMVTVPVGMVKAAGLAEDSAVKLQLIGPASAREAAEAAGKGKEYVEAHTRKKTRLKVKKTEPDVGARAKAPVSSEKPVEGAALSKAKADVAAPEPGGEAAATPPEPESPAVGTIQLSEKPLEEALPRELAEPAGGVKVTPTVPVSVSAPERKRVTRRRREVPEDVVSRVRDSVVAMEKKIIYLHLVPQIVLGRLKTKRQIDEAVDVVFREVAAAS
jgi:hypothetical protein